MYRQLLGYTYHSRDTDDFCPFRTWQQNVVNNTNLETAKYEFLHIHITQPWTPHLNFAIYCSFTKQSQQKSDLEKKKFLSSLMNWFNSPITLNARQQKEQSFFSLLHHSTDTCWAKILSPPFALQSSRYYSIFITGKLKASCGAKDALCSLQQNYSENTF